MLARGDALNMADGAKNQTGLSSIIIARHGRPALNRNAGPTIGWEDYVTWWANYEIGSLAPDQIAPQELINEVSDAEVLLTSVRPRAIETMAAARPDVSPETLSLFNEAPLPPPRWKRAKFLPRRWNVFARIAWLFGHSLGEENVSESRQRAAEAAQYLEQRAAEGKVFLAAHGWFNRMIRTELRRRGWRVVRDQGDRYWGYRKYEYRK